MNIIILLTTVCTTSQWYAMNILSDKNRKTKYQSQKRKQLMSKTIIQTTNFAPLIFPIVSAHIKILNDSF